MQQIQLAINLKERMDIVSLSRQKIILFFEIDNTNKPVL
jgi:hypothetical protein